MKSKIVITCAKGLMPFLKEEIMSIGFPVISENIAGVVTQGTLDDTLRLNLHSRIGHRVLFLVKDFHAADADELYSEISGMAWEDYIEEDGYLCVNSSVENPSIRDSRFANMRCKDAIVDRIRRKKGRRPDSGPDKDKSVVYLYWRDDSCSVYLDTSGEPLSKRGYRKIPLVAPMQETLAASLIAASGWDSGMNFVNPMCGSGTLAIEAALIGLNRAPGLLRGNFGFMHLKGFDKTLWDNLRREAYAASKKTLRGRIIATDIRQDAVEAARKNAVTAGVDQIIEFGACNYAETNVPEGGGVVMLNPEYGDRMGDISELEQTYRGIGDFFKQGCRGYKGYVFTGNPELGKKVGLKAKRRVPFYNSTIECRLLEYELYEGSRKKNEPKDEN